MEVVVEGVVVVDVDSREVEVVEEVEEVEVNGSEEVVVVEDVDVVEETSCVEVVVEEVEEVVGSSSVEVVAEKVVVVEDNSVGDGAGEGVERTSVVGVVESAESSKKISLDFSGVVENCVSASANSRKRKSAKKNFPILIPPSHRICRRNCTRWFLERLFRTAPAQSLACSACPQCPRRRNTLGFQRNRLYHRVSRSCNCPLC